MKIKQRVLDHDAYGITDDCNKCGKPLTFAGIESTLVGYMSPEGHSHDDNCKSAIRGCKDCKWVGEKSWRPFRNFCKDPECDWQGREYCGVCNDVKPQALTKIIEVDPPPPKKPFNPYSTIEMRDGMIEAARANKDAFKKVEEDA